jgi:hypothetical protein
MLRRATSSVATTRSMQVVAARSYFMGPFTDPTRRPQLSDAERAEVKIDQSQWPAVFRDFDPQDPYKKFPDWIENMSAFDYWLLGVEVSFIVVFWDLVFPKSM